MRLEEMSQKELLDWAARHAHSELLKGGGEAFRASMMALYGAFVQWYEADKAKKK